MTRPDALDALRENLRVADRFVAGDGLPGFRYRRLTDDEYAALSGSSAARPAAPAALDVERLAEALHNSDLMRRYSEYADTLPTMTPTPEHTLCIEWAAIIAREYAALSEQDR